MISDQYLATAGQTVKNHHRRLWFGLLTFVMAAILMTPSAASAQNIVNIVEEIEQNGYYVEPASDASLDASLEDARGAGVAFVWLDQAGADVEATDLAEDIWNALDARSSRYRIVLVLLDNGYNGYGPAGLSSDTMNDALDDALAGFSTDAVGDGLSSFTATIATDSVVSGSDGGSTPSTQGGTSGSDAGSAGGFSLSTILLPLILFGGGFWMFRNWSRKRKEDKAATVDMEADRAEIKEQLRDNADRVIELGDRVVLSDDRELIGAYEKASRAYQDVSHGIDGATTVQEVDQLDDRIDQAEWELQMIEARLDGRPVPPSPDEVDAERAREAEEAAARKRAENSRPALGRDESVVGGGSRPRSSYPTGRQPMPGGYGQRRGGFGGGGLGGMLGSIIFGQMQRQQRSRRTRRRTTSLPGGFGGGSSGSRNTGLGGGVLRPGGSRGRSGSGRTFGSRGRKGSGRSF